MTMRRSSLLQVLTLVFLFVVSAHGASTLTTTLTRRFRRRVRVGPGPGRGAGPGGGRIVNGTTAEEGAYPWFTLFDSGACGGTLIAEDRVLTSATCVINHQPETVRVGASNEHDGIEVNVRCSNVHPDYYRSDTGIFNDVAVIKLQEEVDDVDLVTLNNDTSYPDFFEQFFTTMGFGFTENNGPLSDTLQVAQLQIMSPFDCQESYPEMSISGTQHVCAQSPSIGVCTGDSGGPLMDGADSDAIQVGVTSFTFDGCASDAYPDVYAKVATYEGWIQAQIDNDICQGEVFSQSPSAYPSAPPTTPSPTPAPTKYKRDCFFDYIGDLFTGFLPFAAGAADAALDVDYQPEQLEQEQEKGKGKGQGKGPGKGEGDEEEEVEEEQGGGGFLDIIDQIVLGAGGA